MTQRDFLKQLRAELPDHPYRERYLEELKDHAEDLEKDLGEANETLADDLIKRRMGEPKNVKKTFLTIMNPWGPLFFMLEGLFYGGIFIPLAILINTGLRNGLFLDGIIRPSSLFITSVLGGIGLFMIYRLAFRRFLELSDNTLKKRLIWLGLMFMPGTIIFSFITFSLPSHLLIDHSSLILLFDFYLGLHLFSGVLAWKYTLKSREKNKRKESPLQKTVGHLKTFALGYFFLSIVVRTIFINLSLNGEITSPLLESIIPLIGVFSLVIPIEFVSAFWWNTMVNPGYDEVNLFAGFYLPVFLIIFLGLQSLYVVIQQRKWFSFRGLMVLYAVSLFFIHADGFIKPVEFKVPAVNVSELIEKNRVGIFYPILKYFNSDEGSLFKYKVGVDQVDDQGFIVEGNAGKYYVLGLNELEKEFDHPSFNGLVTGVSDTYVNGENSVINKYTSPDETFWDKYIHDRKVPVSDSVLSPDGKWGLIVLPNGAYDPEEVYLVKLQE